MKNFLFLILVLVGLQAQAKTLVISDIDDTLKQSHVLNARDMMSRSVLTDIPFLGMNGVFAALKTNQADLRFFYVTNAIESLMRSFHSRFLTVNAFPEGALYLRSSPFERDYKVRVIRKIVSSEKPDRVLLFGDNGERDIAVHEQIRNDFPNVEIQSYIHVVYSAKNAVETGAVIPPGHIGFATAFDLLLQMEARQLVPPSSREAFFEAYQKTFLLENPTRIDGVLAIPAWMNCRDFVWTLPNNGTGALFFGDVVKEQILRRCGGVSTFSQ